MHIALRQPTREHVEGVPPQCGWMVSKSDARRQIPDRKRAAATECSAPRNSPYPDSHRNCRSSTELKASVILRTDRRFVRQGTVDDHVVTSEHKGLAAAVFDRNLRRGSTRDRESLLIVPAPHNSGGMESHWACLDDRPTDQSTRVDGRSSDTVIPAIAVDVCVEG